MVTYLPISSPFIRFAGRYVDEAFGFAAGWNFFVFEAILVPFEITACDVIIHYWSTALPTWALVLIVIVLYGLINLVNVKWYGEVEFWAALGKVLLIIGLIIFTFVVMLGGNPLGDRFGFRYWNNPGAFKPLYTGIVGEGSLAYFLGFLQCLIQASFVIAGPDYVSMSAGEAENPRVVMPKAYNAVFYRLTTFFVLGALCVGILVPYDDEELTAAFTSGLPGAAASPYVVAMNRLRIGVLPHIVNALVLASAFSAGNSYMYCASRSLFGLALEGKAPKLFTKTNRVGVPYYCVVAVLAVCLLAFLSVESGSAKVLGWFVSLITASQLINFAVMCFTFLMWYRALKAQGIDRNSLPYKSIGQPYVAIYGLAWTFVMAFVGGYTVFLPGFWDASTFVFSYFMIFLTPVLFIFWKVVKKTKWYSPHEVDLKGEVAEIEEVRSRFRLEQVALLTFLAVYSQLRATAIQELRRQVVQQDVRRVKLWMVRRGKNSTSVNKAAKNKLRAKICMFTALSFLLQLHHFVLPYHVLLLHYLIHNMMTERNRNISFDKITLRNTSALF